ncbi:MAG: hypothetical protein A2106_01530 [Planctomycetes bacterium GWF2_40_8]|nr:MAG: hypothetical protein A2106_01530 [Planctomycetes bacterium GWF2_40_8]
MASSLANNMINHNVEIYNVAKKFESKGIKPRDALHLACALNGKAKEYSEKKEGCWLRDIPLKRKRVW